MNKAIAVAVACVLALSATVAFASPGVSKIGSTQLKTGSVTMRVLSGSVKRKIRRAARLPANGTGPAGAQGAQGEAGPAGASCSSTETLDIPSIGLVTVCVP